MKTTYHAKDGKFSASHAAHSAVRNGERLKVVRQLRKLKRGAPKSAAGTLVQSNFARMRSVLNGELTAPGFISLSDFFSESSVKKVTFHGVLAGAYRGKGADLKETLIHASIDGGITALCRKVKADSLADDQSLLGYPEVATCELCKAKLAKLKL